MEQAALSYRPTTSPENLFIRKIWSANEFQSVKRSEKVLPKGTAEIIFNLSDDIYGFKTDEKNGFFLPKCFINGLNFTPIHLSTKGAFYFVGIQINIFALNYIFKIPSVEFNDQVVEGALVCKSLDELAEKLYESSSFYEQVNTIRKWLSDKIKAGPIPEANNRMVKLASDPEVTHLSVKDLSDRYNASPRHLSRLCIEHFGMCAEDVILYRKYLASLYQIHQNKDSLTSIGYDCGFYDQPHFARTFKLFTGLTPKQYRRAMGDLPGHIFEISEVDVTPT